MGVVVDPVNGLLENNRSIIVQGWGLAGFVCWKSEWKYELIVYQVYLILIQLNHTDSFGFSPDSPAHSDKISRLYNSVVHPFCKIRSTIRALEALSLGRFSFLLKYIFWGTLYNLEYNFTYNEAV